MNKAMWKTVTLATCLTVALALVASLPAAASKFRVQLTNGTEFNTLYLPKEAGWDTNMLIFQSSTGNWVAISKDEVAQIVSTLQQQGFGRIIDDKTVEIGYTANFGATDEELEAAEAERTDLDRYLDTLRELSGGRQAPDYTVDQFVNPGEAGGGGIPAGFGAPNAPSTRDF
jgi:hypothetical protein